MTTNQKKPISRRENISDDEVEDIRELYGEGKSQIDIAEIYGVSQSYVSAIVNYKARTERDEYRRKDILKDYPEYAFRIINFSRKTNKFVLDQHSNKILYNKSEIERLVSLFKMIDEGLLVDSQSAGEIIGVSRERVRQYRKDGRFTIITIGNREFMYRSEIEEFKQMREKRKMGPEKVYNPVMSFPH